MRLRISVDESINSKQATTHAPLTAGGVRSNSELENGYPKSVDDAVDRKKSSPLPDQIVKG